MLPSPLLCPPDQDTVTRGLNKVGAEKATPVVLGPVTWVHLSRNANLSATSEQTTALKKQYLQDLLPIYKVLQKLFFELC